ncbi:ATP-dependent nuclease [Candidatus Palauibacter sp.]|uniref:ATP-dependent nuclease n=1 Tax=Candidatus Palauibacter sp. TaxID=3101350 RepID=UPI003B5A82C0
MADVSITSVQFSGYKALKRMSVRLNSFNVLVGPNNCGKSTVIGAFRVLEVAMRRARARGAQLCDGPARRIRGWNITPDALPISLENVHSDLASTRSSVLFRMSNKNTLLLDFPEDGGCFLFADTPSRQAVTPSGFRTAFPVSIGVVPVLGPVEHEETTVQEATVKRNLSNHRASRHFRNYWMQNPEGFDQFSELITQTWPGMELEPPEVVDLMAGKLGMFCREDRMTRELYWAGFGFQVWCQILTHALRSRDATTLVIDEPEIYLHPDLQRKLVTTLRGLGPDILIATHSTEIMGEVDPTDILLLEKQKRTAGRLKSIEDVQGATERIGSVHNVTLTQLSRTRRVLFVEGSDDFKRLRKFATVLGLQELASGLDITPVESEGFANWERISASAWGIEKTLGTPLCIGAVFDRDYWPQEQIEEIVADLGTRVPFLHVLARKEMENYLLQPAVLQRVVERGVKDRARRQGEKPPTVKDVTSLLRKATDLFRADAEAQYVSRRIDYHDRSGRPEDRATVTREMIEWFAREWSDLETRVCIVPGKRTLAEFRRLVQDAYSVSLTNHQLISGFTKAQVPTDLQKLLYGLDEFRRTVPG